MAADGGRRTGGRRTGSGVVLSASDLLGPGTRRARWALSLRLLRVASLVLLAVGLTTAVAVGRTDAVEDLDSPVALARALTTPLALLAVGVLLRLVISPLVFLVIALDVTRAGHDVVADHDRRSLRARLVDRFRLSSAAKVLLWTTAVRDESADRLGRTGRLLVLAERALWVLAVVGLLAMVPAAFVAG